MCSLVDYHSQLKAEFEKVVIKQNSLLFSVIWEFDQDISIKSFKFLSFKMYRIFKFKPNHITSCRQLALTANLTQSIDFEKEWSNARPFEEIPGLNKLGAIRAFLPAGIIEILVKCVI